MYIKHTYQDWLLTPEGKRLELLEQIIASYKGSDEFKAAAVADGYYTGEHTAVDSKYILKPQKVTYTEEGREKKCTHLAEVSGNRINCDFFRRFVVQRTHYSLANGVVIDGKPSEDVLGGGVDHAISTAAQKAQIHGLCWGYWNADHLEIIPAYDGGLSGFVALVDERTSQPMVGIHFWQLDTDRPLWVRLFETDGLTEYRKAKDDAYLVEYTPKRPYKLTIATDAAGSEVVDGENYGALPVVPLYANDMQRSTLTPAIKRKIDAYDVITSDFADNLEQANEIYWVLNNFGGTQSDIAETLETIHKLKAIANVSDGMGSSTVEAKSFDVPYAARQTAIALLTETLHDDAMIVNLKEITGGSLTNVAIETAFTRMDLGADELEWQVFTFVQQLLRLNGVDTEDITFKRARLFNTSETIQNIYLMRQDISRRTALTLNPMIGTDEVDQIMEEADEEQAASREMAAIAAAVDTEMEDNDDPTAE